MHKPESVVEKETHKILCDFEIQTHHQIANRNPVLQIIKKRICSIVDIAVPADYRVKIKESEKRETYLDLAKKLS